MTQTTDKKPQTEQEALAAYEELKKQNRRRLIGAGAITLLAGGLLAAVVGNEPKNPQPAIVDNSTKQQAVSTEVLRPAGAEQAPQVQAASDVAEVQTDVAALSASELAAEPSQAQIASQEQQDDSEPIPVGHLTAMISPAPLAASKLVSRANNSATLGIDGVQAAPATAAERRAERARQREQERQARAERARQREQERLAAERVAEQRRREAAAVSARIEAEQAARQKAAAERMRQAKLAAEQKRQQEREQWLARQKQQQTTQAARGTTQQSARVDVVGNGRVLVQAGAFSTREQAQQIQARVRGLGYGAQVEEVRTSKGKMYRVRTSTFANRAAAEQAAGKLKSHGLGGMIVELK